MKAAILTAPNAMALGDAPDPTPADGDLVLRVKAATICGTDIRIYRGRKVAGVRYPSIIGHEFSGKDPAEWKWPYDIPCWVFTHRALTVVPGAQVVFTSADVTSVHAEMVNAAGVKNVWIVGGGDLVGQFADVGLLDEVIVYIAPITLGRGKPLLARKVELRLEELARNGDFACARYSVVSPAEA